MTVPLLLRSEGRHAPYRLCGLLGLGGLASGATGPLVSTYLPLLVASVLDDRRLAIGAVMAIDNALLLLIVPWAGVASDRAGGRHGRLRYVVGGLVLAGAGMALLPTAVQFGLAGLLTAIVTLQVGINIWRSPFQALVADLVPSRYRSLATGSVTFCMCVSAIAYLLIANAFGMGPAYYVAAATLVGLALVHRAALRETGDLEAASDEATLPSILDAASLSFRGVIPGIRAIFLATLFLQMTFQSFTTWFALHATERFGLSAEQASFGFIAWALGGVIGAAPAGPIGLWFGRRNALLLGFGIMVASLLTLDRVTSFNQAAPLIVITSASWALPMVNAFPLFIEPLPPQRRGVLTALFVLCMALGGLIGDPMNGRLFDLFDTYRPLFLMMAVYSATALVAVLCVPRGAGEAETGPMP